MSGTPFELGGSVAVVTGATRGLGRAISRQLGGAGARVVLVGRSTQSDPHQVLPGTLEEVAAELRGLDVDVLSIRADLSTIDDARRVVEETLAWAGRCDALVCNASYTPAGTFLEVPASRWNLGWNVTVTSSVVLCQGFLPGMLERGMGRIIAVGSASAEYRTAPASDWARRPDGYGEPLLYGVSKAALERMIAGMHDEFGGRGVAFTNLRAGEMSSEAYHFMSKQLGMDGPTDQVHTPEEAARSVLWLLGQPESISGRIVDFGWLQEHGALAVR
ncbi:SDR family NAD(P)-dependent oxidoreductase [Mycolicibacterium hodleri]|uniref:3-oxoacyl-[acyl-carrier-protein] reductase MabA n=1 Tax=Mycolicibacterium hodleri TaxID=49897 RepID=A0A502DY02_9MYCO|nr:SDR family oxidoreductase [Mycolicibacterium hodleri]TPG29559.1 SDR family oxidoreductase [Mycolicibacterium hodleri]